MCIQSELLGAHVLDLRNLILITGDPSRNGNYPDATAVFDVDAIGLTKIVSNLNRGLDIGGNFIGNQTGFLLAIAANPGASNFAHEIERLEAKIRLGAECIITAPVFDIEQLERFLERIRPFRVPVLAAIWPLTSYRNAEFLSNEMQVVIPKRILERMQTADSGEAARAEGLLIAQELASRLRHLVQGVQVGAPLGRYGMVAEVLSVLSKREAVGIPFTASQND